MDVGLFSLELSHRCSAQRLMLSLLLITCDLHVCHHLFLQDDPAVIALSTAYTVGSSAKNPATLAEGGGERGCGAKSTSRRTD